MGRRVGGDRARCRRGRCREAPPLVARRGRGPRRGGGQLRGQGRDSPAPAPPAAPAAARQGTNGALVPVGARDVVHGRGHRHGEGRTRSANTALRPRRGDLPDAALPGHALSLRRARWDGARPGAWRCLAGTRRQGDRGPADRPGRELPALVKIGIVGLPNAGKTTLFNALTRSAAATATYPFTTVEPNVAIVDVPAERLEPVARAAGASPTVPETIEFRDIAGLVRGAAGGEGLGNRFLAEIRETDAICHVVRSHGDERVPHPEGRVDPLDDLEVVEAELLLADLEQGEARLERVRKQAASGSTEDAAERDWLERVVEALGRGEAVRELRAPELVLEAPERLQALTSKPVLYVANVDEGEREAPPALLERAGGRDRCIAVSAR